MSSGSTITHLTLRTLPLALKLTTTTCITGQTESFSLCVVCACNRTDASVLAPALAYVNKNRTFSGFFLRIFFDRVSLRPIRMPTCKISAVRPTLRLVHPRFPLSRSDDLLSQIEMILRKMPCWGTTPTGLASFLFPRSSTRRMTSYASGQTRRSSNIVKAMDGWYVIPPRQSPFLYKSNLHI